jgi:glycosyltransferase involved in cell wall biosynthesis
MTDRPDDHDRASTPEPTDSASKGATRSRYGPAPSGADRFGAPFSTPGNGDGEIAFDPLDPLGLSRLGPVDQLDPLDDPLDRPGRLSPLASLEPPPPLAGSGLDAHLPPAGSVGEPVEGLVIDRATGLPVELPDRGAPEPRLGGAAPSDDHASLVEDALAVDLDRVTETGTDRVIDVDLHEPLDDLPRWDPLSDDLPEELAVGLAAEPAAVDELLIGRRHPWSDEVGADSTDAGWFDTKHLDAHQADAHEADAHQADAHEADETAGTAEAAPPTFTDPDTTKVSRSALASFLAGVSAAESNGAHPAESRPPAPTRAADTPAEQHTPAERVPAEQVSIDGDDAAATGGADPTVRDVPVDALDDLMFEPFPAEPVIPFPGDEFDLLAERFPAPDTLPAASYPTFDPVGASRTPAAFDGLSFADDRVIDADDLLDDDRDFRSAPGAPADPEPTGTDESPVHESVLAGTDEDPPPPDADDVPADSSVQTVMSQGIVDPSEAAPPVTAAEPAPVIAEPAASVDEPAPATGDADLPRTDEPVLQPSAPGAELDGRDVAALDTGAHEAEGPEPVNPPGPVHPDHPSDLAFMTYSGFAGSRQYVGFQVGSLPDPAVPERGVPNLIDPDGVAAVGVGDELAGAGTLTNAYPMMLRRDADELARRATADAEAGGQPAPDLPVEPEPPAQPDALSRPAAYREPAPDGEPGLSVVPSGRQVRAAVYNRFWHSMGGGERHNGMIAQVMAADGANVDILGHSDVDLAELGAHLGLDLSGCRFVKIPDRGEDDISVLSGQYDLFVNGSYMSRIPARSRKAAYLCFFPTPFDHDMAAWRKAAVRSAGPLLRGVRPAVDFGLGWYPPEGGRVRQWRWSSGNAVLSISAGGRRALRADFGRPGAPTGTPLRILGPDGDTLAKIDVGAEFVPHDIPLPESEVGTEITLVCEPFTPGPADVRELGVAISKPRVVDAQEGLPAKVALRFPWLLRDPNDLAWLDRYDVVMANSDYTRTWIRRMWRNEADVLYPPIQVDRLRPAETREKSIITVGRFFAPGLGHAKRQLEMVRWFGELHNSGALPGWTMHVVGGMEDSQKNYVEQIRAAGAGLPVEVHPNAPRSEVERLLSTASVFWSATGWGEDERRKPWTAEHFGMTTVEAMAGGAVPVVIDRAGQREIVRHSIDGFRWTEPEQLMSFTRRLAAEEGLRSRLAAEATQRAQLFSDAAFADRWRTIASRHHLYEG